MALLETQPDAKHCPRSGNSSNCVCRQRTGQNDFDLWSPHWNEQCAIHASSMSLQADRRDTGRERNRHRDNVSGSIYVLLWTVHYHKAVVNSFNLILSQLFNFLF